MPHIVATAALALGAEMLLCPSLPAAGRAAAASAWPRVLIPDAISAGAVRWALAGASQWLADGGCQSVFSQFRDSSGRPLDEKLTEAGQTAQDYLALIFFSDGSGEAPCRERDSLAVTTPGSRVVWVCGRQFERAWRADPRQAQAVIIHEALHTLGLGENPPSSVTITTAVLSRCGR